MAKVADLYYQLDPWIIKENGFDIEHSEVSEAIFSLGNEYMGVRGYFEEGISSPSLLGSYFNGIYENSHEENRVQYKGIVKRSHFMVNAVDWLYTRLTVAEETLDFAKSTIHSFQRNLDLRSGILQRSFIWVTKQGPEIKVIFERFLDMEQANYGFQKIQLQTSEPVAVELVMGADFNTIHQSQEMNFWQQEKAEFYDSGAMILGKTLTSNQQIYSRFTLENNQSLTAERLVRDKFIALKFNVKLEPEKIFETKRYTTNVVAKTPMPEEDLIETGVKLHKTQLTKNFDDYLQAQVTYWQRVWQKYDIEIEGDELNQQGIRFCIFQLQQTYHGQNPSNNIGAKGLTGESYGGHAFWDTETCCLPFYLLNNLEAAKNLLEFRYQTLPEARNRANELDCQGACYPIATLNGNEASDLWQHASLQFQPSTGVAYGIWHYVNLSDDQAFLTGHGIEMLIEISRFLASRGDWGANGEFGFFGVMGPDEFQMMVNHNAYTNYMAMKTFQYTLATLNSIKKSNRERYEELQATLLLNVEEEKLWQRCVDHTLIIQTEEGLIEQHDGFFKLPHVDIHQIPITDFPLYHHWSYDRIYRNDMIKQPDVLMFQFLYNQDFTKESKRINYDYYEPKTIHESSLSPSIHSILAAELGKKQEAYDFFGFATRMDLDNYNRNTREGLHTTSIAAAWMNIVYGFGGIRTDGPELLVAPSIPDKWSSYTFKITYQGALIEVKVSQSLVQLRLLEGEPVTFRLYDRVIRLGEEPILQAVEGAG
ncbi:glycoside hydrolase family 65 protein [Enterococcus sp. 2201sp1_2201st1_B8_2201SCRN_220225]|uniref:glycoside hydrolase family 65 protein n=1 Tax=unclassified Enterococcus TaxID=2608891 RepID=UPI0034A132C0